MNQPIFEGSGVAIVTPFTERGVNYKKLEQLVDFHLQKGSDAIVVCGSTGEASTIIDAKTGRIQPIKFVFLIPLKRLLLPGGIFNFLKLSLIVVTLINSTIFSQKTTLNQAALGNKVGTVIFLPLNLKVVPLLSNS